MLRWAAIEAAQQAWRPNNPWNQLYLDVKQRCGGKGNPAKAAVARKVLIAAWHVLALNSPSTLRAPAARTLLSRPAPVAFWPTDGPQGIEKPGQLRPTRCAQPSAERELSHYRTHPQRRRTNNRPTTLDTSYLSKRAQRAAITSPERDRDRVKRRLRRAWAETDHDHALEQLQTLGSELEHPHPGAAGSLREGLAETLTVIRLGVTGKLARRSTRRTRRDDDRVHPPHRTQRQALEHRRDGLALDRGRDARSRAPVPKVEGYRGLAKPRRRDRTRTHPPSQHRNEGLTTTLSV